METLKTLHIQPTTNTKLEEKLQYKLDQKTKPLGSLGQMERIALQTGLIQQTLNPELNKPVMFTIAADHAITDEGVSPCPAEITWQQVLNFINGGGGIGLFCQHYGFDFYAVDAGVDYTFEPHPKLIDAKVRNRTRNFLQEPAMTTEECNRAMENGREIVKKVAKEGTNIVGFGEMGIGNTSPASALLSIYTNRPVEECTGPGSGLNSEGVNHKTEVIKKAIAKHGISDKPEENLARFGGLEIATIAGGMLEAAAQRMCILVDGFITTSAFMAAYEINSAVRDYAFFSHCSHEQGHIKMLNHVKGEAILNLDLRLGEGTGAAVALPVMQGSIAMLNKMTSFDEAKVFNTANEAKEAVQ